MFKQTILLILIILTAACVGKNVNIVSSTIDNKEAYSSSNTEINWYNVPRFRNIDFIDKEEIWAATAKDAKLILTEDGGKNWKAIDNENIEFGVKLVDFVDNDHGWLVVDADQLLLTSDGGKTWQEKSPEFLFTNPFKIKFTDLSDGWVLDGNQLLHSKDGGRTWKEALPENKYPHSNLQTFFFLSSEKGWVCDGENKSTQIYKTTDSGENWLAVKIPSKAYGPCRVFFNNSEEGWLSVGFADEQDLFFTSNGGDSWKKIPDVPKDYEIRSMFWFNSKEGWTAGYFRNVEIDTPRKGRGTVLRTIDGGQSWLEVDVDKQAPFFDQIYFTDTQNGLPCLS